MRWLCLDCDRIVELNRHGYCSICGSNSVDSAERREADPVQSELIEMLRQLENSMKD